MFSIYLEETVWQRIAFEFLLLSARQPIYIVLCISGNGATTLFRCLGAFALLSVFSVCIHLGCRSARMEALLGIILEICAS